MRKSTALVYSHLLPDELPAGRVGYSKQIVVTVSQELTTRLGAGFNGHALTRMARFVGWMPFICDWAPARRLCRPQQPDTRDRVTSGYAAPRPPGQLRRSHTHGRPAQSRIGGGASMTKGQAKPRARPAMRRKGDGNADTNACAQRHKLLSLLAATFQGGGVGLARRRRALVMGEVTLPYEDHNTGGRSPAHSSTRAPRVPIGSGAG